MIEQPLQEDRSAAGSPARTMSSGARIATIICLVLFLISLPLAITSAWLRFQILDTNAFVKAVSPIMDSETNRLELAGAINDRLVVLLNQSTSPNVQALIDGAGGVDAVTAETQKFVTTIVNDPEFITLWRQLNQSSHRFIISLLQGTEGNAGIQGHNVYVDVAAIVRSFASSSTGSIGAIITELIPPNGTVLIAVFSNPDLPVLEWMARNNNWLLLATTALAIASLGAFFWLSQQRWRAAKWAGFLTAGVMVVLVIVVNVLIADELADVSSTAESDLATEYIASLISWWVLALIIAFLAGLVVGIAGWIGERRARPRSPLQNAIPNPSA